jgi:dienelactone hydrolase
VRRRRLVAASGLASALVAASVVVVAARSGGGTGSHTAAGAGSAPAVTAGPPTTPVPAAPATTVPPAPTTTAKGAPVDVERRYAVGVHSATLVDASRTTSPNGGFGGAPNRRIRTTIWYPATGDAGAAAQDEATPDRAHGPFPLVLFAHGYAVTPSFYRPLLERWAAAGYVVAAPTFPILSGSPGGASHVDYEKTFGDAQFVITQLTDRAATDPIAPIVDPTRIAIAGHSDGEVIAFALGFLACCRDPRIVSVVAMAGDLSNANNPSVRDTGTPILHIMEDHDEYDPYPHSIQWDRENLTAPRWMLTMVNASHVPPYTQPGNPSFELVSAATIAFFDGTLKGHPERLDAIAADAAAHPTVAALER